MPHESRLSDQHDSLSRARLPRFVRFGMMARSARAPPECPRSHQGSLSRGGVGIGSSARARTNAVWPILTP